MIRTPLVAAAVGFAVAAAAPASAQIATHDPGRFVDTLAERSLAMLKGDKAAARAQFRSLLAQHFAVDAIGDRLIRNQRPRISSSQYSAYKSAFPKFIIGTYADRLYPYAGADLKVVRVQQQGNGAAVLSTITKPGQRPVNVIWSLIKVGGAYKVSNLTVGGVNVALTQAADFNSYAQRNGFDALIKFMRSRA